MRSLSSTDWSQLRYTEADDKVASALMTMGLASTGDNSENTDRVDQTEELCQNLLIVLFTILWKGIDSSEESAWKVLHCVHVQWLGSCTLGLALDMVSALAMVKINPANGSRQPESTTDSSGLHSTKK